MQNLTVLWLDDQRDPQKYFAKKDEKGEGTLHDNLVFYSNLRKQYNLSFVWVKTFKEFANYIMKNGMPKFISFDHDLSKTSLPTDPKGLDCAQWLVDYCKKNGTQMPMTYVHSANPKWRGVIRNILAGNSINERKNIRNMKINEQTLRKIIRNALMEMAFESNDWTNHDFAASQNSIDQDYEYEGQVNSSNPNGEHSYAYVVTKFVNGTEMYNFEDEQTEELIFQMWFNKPQFMDENTFVAIGEDGVKYRGDWTSGNCTRA